MSNINTVLLNEQQSQNSIKDNVIDLNKIKFEKRKEKQLDYLAEQIITGENKDKFLLQTHEAALGKSITAEKAMVDAYIKNDRKSLFVVRYNHLAEESETRINEYISSKFKGTGFIWGDIAIAMDKDNRDKLLPYICNYPIAIITHERYKQLSKDKKQFKQITDGRYNLIIDEEVDIIEQYTYDLERIRWFDSVLPVGRIKILYNQIIYEMQSLITTNKKRTFYNMKNKMEKEIKEFRDLIDVNISPAYARRFKHIAEDREMYKNDFLNEVYILEQLLNYTCILEHGILYTYDHNIQYWKLDNNIYMDANGFNHIYKLSDDFDTEHMQSRIVNHNNWIMYHCNSNSTKTAKESTVNYYDEVNRHIKKILSRKNKMFLVSNKAEKEAELFDVPYAEDHNYFGNITGTNQYRDYDMCYIVHNPNTPIYYYALKYLYYVGGYKQSREIHMKKEDYIYKFRNKDIDAIRKTYLAGEIYQAIKRINRDNQLNARVYIINNDAEVVNLVKRQMKNINIKEFELEFEYEKSEKQQEHLDELNDKQWLNSYGYKFTKLCDEILEGNYKDEGIIEGDIIKFKMKWVREKLGIKNSSIFSNKVLKHTKVIAYMEVNEVEPVGHNIVFKYL